MRNRHRSASMQRAIHGLLTPRAARHVRARAWLAERREFWRRRRELQRYVVTSVRVNELALMNGAPGVDVPTFRWDDFMEARTTSEGAPTATSETET